MSKSTEADLPDYLKEFKQEYEKIVKKETSRIKLPVLSQMSNSLKSKLSVLPTAGMAELEKVESYIKDVESTNINIAYTNLTSVVEKSKANSQKNDNNYNLIGNVNTNNTHKRNKSIRPGSKNNSTTLIDDSCLNYFKTMELSKAKELEKKMKEERESALEAKKYTLGAEEDQVVTLLDVYPSHTSKKLPKLNQKNLKSRTATATTAYSSSSLSSSSSSSSSASALYPINSIASELARDAAAHLIASLDTHHTTYTTSISSSSSNLIISNTKVASSSSSTSSSTRPAVNINTVPMKISPLPGISSSSSLGAADLSVIYEYKPTIIETVKTTEKAIQLLAQQQIAHKKETEKISIQKYEHEEFLFRWKSALLDELDLDVDSGFGMRRAQKRAMDKVFYKLYTHRVEYGFQVWKDFTIIMNEARRSLAAKVTNSK